MRRENLSSASAQLERVKELYFSDRAVGCRGMWWDAAGSYRMPQDAAGPGRAQEMFVLQMLPWSHQPAGIEGHPCRGSCQLPHANSWCTDKSPAHMPVFESLLSAQTSGLFSTRNTQGICRQASKMNACPGFSWDRVSFHLSSWCSAVFWIWCENNVDSTLMFSVVAG